MRHSIFILVSISIVFPTISGADSGYYNEENGDRFVERVIDNMLEIAPGGSISEVYVPEPVNPPPPFNHADVLWSVEEWHGDYGAICEDTDVSANGDYILCSWNLNYEKWELYEADTGNLVWTYDLLPDDRYVGGAVNGDISGEGSVICGCVSGWAESYGQPYKGTLLKFNDGSSTPDWTYDFPYTDTVLNSSSRPVDVKVTPDGSKIVCVVANVTDDPAKPHQLYIFNSSSATPILVVDLPNSGETPYGFNITDDASIITYGTYQNIYVYDDSGTQLDSFSVDYGWQYAPGLSEDGTWMAYGNYHGQLRLYEWSGSDYTQSWQYTITPDYYYPWVISVDIVGDTLMMGSYQPNASGNRGYAYIFDTSSSTPTWTSADFGDFVSCVDLNRDDASVGIASSYGPTAGNGWRSALFMTDNATPYFVMDQTSPGSHFSSELSDDGVTATAGGKRVHAREFGSGGWLYCIGSTETGVDDGDPTTPSAFALYPAYPNPANDKVTISFALPRTSSVTLDIFDIKGRKVESVIDGEMSPGEHEVSIATGNLAGGVYLYRLTADEDSAVKKLVIR